MLNEINKKQVKKVHIEDVDLLFILSLIVGPMKLSALNVY